MLTTRLTTTNLKTAFQKKNTLKVTMKHLFLLFAFVCLAWFVKSKEDGTRMCKYDDDCKKAGFCVCPEETQCNLKTCVDCLFPPEYESGRCEPVSKPISEIKNNNEA